MTVVKDASSKFAAAPSRPSFASGVYIRACRADIAGIHRASDSQSLGRMDSSKLTKTQARQLHNALYPHCNYLFRLRRRMEQLGFTVHDPLFAAVTRAYNAMHELSVEIHYLSCESGVGRPSSER